MVAQGNAEGAERADRRRPATAPHPAAATGARVMYFRRSFMAARSVQRLISFFRRCDTTLVSR
jgi:hypothetical protein